MSKTNVRKKSRPKASPNSGQNGETEENLDQVRDILFGGQMRAVESRLARMEERIGHERDAMRADLEKQMAQLERYTKKEVEALGEKVAGERSKRADDLKALRLELRNSGQSLDKRLAKLDEVTTTADAELRTQLLEHGKTMAQRMKKLSEDFGKELERAIRQLQGEKADKASLVEVFSQVVVSMTDDLESHGD